MGSCCSNQENHDPNKTIDTITTIEPLVKRNNFDPNLRKVDNEDIVFQKIDVSASSDNLDTKELDKMMKTDDEAEDIDDDDVDDNEIDDVNEENEEEEEQN